mgnify:CR=1 FL=1
MNEKNPFDSIPEDPNFVLVNPDEPDVNPQVWSETKGGTEGVFTGEKKAPRKKPSPRPKASDSPYVTKRFLAVALVLAVIFSSALGAFLGSRMSGGGSYSNLDSNNSLESATGSKLTIQQIYKKNADAVVEISTEVPTKSVLGNSVSQGAGSGVIVNKKGYIATNYHVIEGAKKITVRLRNGRSRSASVVGYDEGNDIAVLKIGGSGYTAATIGKSKKVQMGDLAVAIGNPMGQVHGSVTAGIISAVEQELTIDDVTINAIQTDAAINPGNSGGALFDSYGNVIGIVYAKSSSVSIEGIGYAIPVNNIKDLVAQMINDPDSVKDQTKGSQIMLGITIRDITEEMSKQYSMPVGVYITEVSSMSAAERAGLQKGDIITEFAGETVTSADDLNAIKAKQTSGDTVSVKIDRNGKTLTLDLVVPQPTDVDTSSSK